MSQNRNEKEIILEPSQQPFKRRDFLKRSSIIPVAGALHVLGGGALLLASTDASAAGPDFSVYAYIGQQFTGRTFNPALGETDNYLQFYRNKNYSADKNDWCQIWKKAESVLNGRTTVTWAKSGSVGNILQSSTGKRVLACYNNAGTQIAFIPGIYLECAAPHGRRLTTTELTSGLFPSESYARTIKRAQTLWGGVPQFTYITYVLAGRTYYRFLRFAADVSTGYITTGSIESIGADYDRIAAVLNAIAEYDKAVLAVTQKLVLGVVGAGIGMALGLTDAATGVAAYGVASIFVVAAGSIPIAYFDGMYAISAKNVKVALAMSRFTQDYSWDFQFQTGNQCPADEQVRI